MNDSVSSGFIVHIGTDEKFVDMALREFEVVAPGMNQLIILGRERPLRYVKNKSMKFYSVKSARMLIQSRECAAVIFHSIGDDLTLLSDIPANKKVIWLGWGYDYYARLLADAYPAGFLLATSKALLPNTPVWSLARIVFRKVKTGINISLDRKVSDGIELLSRVDVFSPVIEIEHRMACNLNTWFRPKYVTWNYGTFEDDFVTNEVADKQLGIDILVGNSATLENNHLEVFEVLERSVDLTGRRIIVPLSYGDEWYKEKLISVGRSKFGEQFVPLTNFMTKEAYIDLLQQCGLVFMNHLRQQALGTICIMMIKGAKLYMNPASPLYHWLLERGAVIKSIDALGDVVRTKQQVLLPLSKDDQLRNISVIRAHWGRETQRARTRQLIDIALGAL